MATPEFFRDASPEQRKAYTRAYTELKRLLKNRNSSPAWFLAVGEHVDALAPRRKKGTYGNMRVLARALGGEKSLQALLHVARQAFNCYGDMPRRELKGLGWMQLRYLMTVPNRKDRAEMRKQCRLGNWSAEKLRLRIVAEYGKRNKAGRRLASRKDYEPAMLLREVMRLTDQWLALYPAWFSDSFANLPRSHVTAALKLDIESADQRLSELAERIESAKQILRRLAGSKRSKAGAKSRARRTTKKAASKRG